MTNKRNFEFGRKKYRNVTNPGDLGFCQFEEGSSIYINPVLDANGELDKEKTSCYYYHPSFQLLTEFVGPSKLVLKCFEKFEKTRSSSRKKIIYKRL